MKSVAISEEIRPRRRGAREEAERAARRVIRAQERRERAEEQFCAVARAGLLESLRSGLTVIEAAWFSG